MRYDKESRERLKQKEGELGGREDGGLGKDVGC
jgi:hypothetical protein